MLHWACSGVGWFAGRRCLNTFVFLKPTHLEDSLCAPGSPLLRLKDAVWHLAY